MFNVVRTLAPLPGHVAQSVNDETADTRSYLTADSGVTNLILACSHTFLESDHETISSVVLLPYTDSRRVVVSYK